MSMLNVHIRQRREALGMSQAELAKLLGYSDRSTIAKIENGTNDITQSKIEAFAKVLHTTPAYLMGWEDDSGDRDLYLTAIDVAKWLDTDPEVVEAVMSDMGWPDVTSEILSKISAEVERRKIRILTHGESALIKAFLKLNDDGQKKAVESVEIIAGNPKYQRTAPQEGGESPPPARKGNDDTPQEEKPPTGP